MDEEGQNPALIALEFTLTTLNSSHLFTRVDTMYITILKRR